MDPNLITALTVAVPAVFASSVVPLLTLWMTSRNKRIERSEDWARQDEVAKRLSAQQKLTDIRVDEQSQMLKSAKAERALTDDKIDSIHFLVNSNMTAAMQAELDATRREVALMFEVIELKKASGKQPTAEVLAAITATKNRIAELQASLVDRQPGVPLSAAT